MSTNITTHMQCNAAIISHFRWHKVTAIYENSNSFSADSGLVTLLSDALELSDSAVKRHAAFPPVSSLSDPGTFVEKELKKLRSKSNRVFVVLQSSLEFALILFEKAKQMGMMEREYVWIVSDEIASLLDSVDDNFISANMQGVIGCKTNFVDTSKSYRQFKLMFRRKYRLVHPEEEEYSNPSLFALRAYDATLALAKALEKSQGITNSKELLNSLLSSDFRGLSGEVSFKNGELSQSPVFRIINVVGRKYRVHILYVHIYMCVYIHTHMYIYVIYLLA
ncbi:glutamate receptor 2.7-like [Actinidia eriantha]|uniref:glutamate receptor 2.7-like n=1 Tax=Actinidia eriantha TaxID=165200 RepID=UPI002586DAE0|nr:glutamate receptor 2.7-like [Actinidia eriantha]